MSIYNGMAEQAFMLLSAAFHVLPTHFCENVITRCTGYCTRDDSAGSNVHSYRLGLVTWRYQFESRSGRIIVIVVVHIQCSKLFRGMECTLHYKEPLKSFEKIVWLRLGFGLPFVTILPCAESDVKQYSHHQR